MKIRFFKNIVIIISSMAFIGILGCEGPEGPTGPQGAQGTEGPQGPEGTANVIYSDWIRLGDVASSADTSLIGRNYKRYHIPADELTQEIIDGGTIIVYYKLLGMITPLPYTLAGLSGSEDLLITFATFMPRRITILSQLLDNTPTILNLDTNFRYILIPGGIPAKQKTSVFSDYYKTMDYYGIEY